MAPQSSPTQKTARSAETANTPAPSGVGGAMADLATPALSSHVRAKAPVPATTSGLSSVMDVRLGRAGVKRLWNRLQGMLGVGDAGALARANEVVRQARGFERGLVGASDAALREQLSGLRHRLADVTSEKQQALVEARAQLLEARKAGNDAGIRAAQQNVQARGRELQELEANALDELCPQVFALVAEASARNLKMRPYDVQLMAGALLARGKVVEQYTGEGKTLSAVAPAVLHALNGRGVHIATSANALAKRDATKMAPAYNALGLSVAALLPDGTAIRIDPPDGKERACSRKEAYEADVVYATAAQLGFDHLRDNLVTDPAARVQRGHAALLMDEVDSLLIDDARTPLIIADEPGEAHDDVRRAITEAVEKLELGKDIEFDRSEGWAYLSDEGSACISELLGLSELEIQGSALHGMIDNAVRARTLFVSGIDYLVQDQKVELIGRNGEVLPGRRLAAGLHQAIEAREGVEVSPETRTVGSITLREYLGLYSHVGGMTGTAETSEGIFDGIYRLDVVRVPTHRPLQRVDESTRLFATIEDKALALLEDAKRAAAEGRPVLVGVPDERSAEALSLLFRENGVEHHCFTAKNEEDEAKALIATAGRPGQITLVTPKGGRGVHFELGGDGADEGTRQAVLDRGGLLLLGFEHNSCERIDNQLRGRVARQGQPGTTRFYASLQDRFFQHKELPRWAKENPPGPQGLVGPQATALVQEHSALQESLLEASLKDALPFDRVVGQHRERYLEQREAILHGVLGEGTHGIVEDALVRRIDGALDEHGASPEGLFQLYVDLAHVVPVAERNTAPESWRGLSREDLKRRIVGDVHEALVQYLEQLGEPGQQALKLVLLAALDGGLSTHLEDLQVLRQDVTWQQMIEKDPRHEYVRLANEAWTGYMAETRDGVMRAVLSGMPPVALR